MARNKDRMQIQYSEGGDKCKVWRTKVQQWIMREFSEIGTTAEGRDLEGRSQVEF